VTLAPSSSMTKSWNVGVVSPQGGMNPFRFDTKAILPPATGAGPRLKIPYPRALNPAGGFTGFDSSHRPAPVLGVNSLKVSRRISRVTRSILKMSAPARESPRCGLIAAGRTSWK
jgi:hypothetical protein